MKLALFLQRSVGAAYEKAADHGRAAESFEEAAKLSGSEEERAEELARVAINLFLCGRKESAFTKLTSELGKAPAREAESHLYEGLAALYQKAGEPVLRALALEKALEGRPNSRSLRFKVAYAYNHESISGLSFLHYRKQLEFHPDDPSSLNNIGVEFGRLNMPSRSVRYYKKATERGETLAMANLANLYMHAGFVDEAAQILGKARGMEEVHANVGASLAALSSTQEAESEKEEQCLSAAREQQAFLLAFAEAAFISPKKPRGGMNFVGRWKLPDGTEFDVAQDGNQISGNWEINNSKHYISGAVTNRAFKGVIGYKGQFSFESKERRILGYFGDDPGSLHVITTGTAADDHQITVCRIGDGTPNLEAPGADTKALSAPQSP